MKDYVYSAGSMESVSEEHMKTWRKEAEIMLNEAGIEMLDPTRRISFHDQLEDCLEDVQRNMNTCRKIFRQDLQDIHFSRVILADVRRCAGRAIGTHMEIMHGYHKNKIIILWADENDKPHPFTQAVATEIHYTLEDAVASVKSYY